MAPIRAQEVTSQSVHPSIGLSLCLFVSPSVCLCQSLSLYGQISTTRTTTLLWQCLLPVLTLNWDCILYCTDWGHLNV